VAEVGFDTVAFSFPVYAPDRGEGVMVNGLYGEGTSLRDVRTIRKLPSGGTLRSGVGGRAAVEFSAKYGREDNVVHLSWDEVVANVEATCLEASDFVEVDGHWSSGRFVRVDATRDFDGGTRWPVIAPALERAVYLPRARSRLFRDRQRNNSLMLAVGHSGFRAAIYDKHGESLGVAPVGRLRYEARNGRKWCDSLGASLHDPGAIPLRAEWLFREARFGSKVGGVFDVLTDLLDAEGLSTSEKLRLLGWLFAEAHGADIRESATTTRKYRALARRLGIVVSEEDRATVSARLDWDEGRLIAEVAA